MTLRKRQAVAFGGTLALLVCLGCEQNAVEDAADDTTDAVESAADETQDAAEDAVDEVEDAVGG
ncbi:MAG: YtxH domain-containing protein [Planctomycetota bacterium]|mgnify:CR=1 FL=1